MDKGLEDHGLVLVFEEAGFVYAYASCDEAAASIESMDVEDGHYLGAFTDRGEVIALGKGDLFAALRPTGRVDHEALRVLIEHSRGPKPPCRRSSRFRSRRP